MTSTQINRRTFLRTTTALGFAGAAGYLFSSSAALAAASDLGPVNDAPVYFRGWQFRTDVVQSNVDKYNADLKGHIDYATVTGNYPALMEQGLIAGDSIDVLYANPQTAVRYVEAGWAMPATEMSNAQEIADAMYPNVRDAWTHKGKLMGLSYFVSTRGAVAVNLERFADAGFKEEEFPKTWTELYAMVHKMHEAGIKDPYLPHWLGETFGISWGFVFEVHNRGGQVADPESHQPALTADGPAGDTLRDWKKLYNAGFISEEVFTFKESDYIDAFRSGRYIFSPQQIYDLSSFNDRTKSAAVAGKVSLLPYQGQSWGLLDSAVYLMSSRKRSDEETQNVKNFVNWYGYKDQNGDISVGKRWLKEQMLFSAYRPVMESDEAREIIEKALARPQDYQTALDVYANTPFPKGVWSVVWAEEFNVWLRDELLNFLQSDGSVEDLIGAINERIVSLNKKYKI